MQAATQTTSRWPIPIFAFVLTLGVASAGWAQTPAPAAAPAPAQSQTDTTPNDPDATIVDPKPVVKTKAELIGEAWDLLTNAELPEKRSDMKIQGLGALGTMGANARSTKLIAKAFADKDVDVRTAAVLAAGQTRDRNLAVDLRKMLDDKEPQVVFTAASVLWKMHDHSGEDILIAIVDGERRTGATLVNGAMHDANKELHSPSGLAKLGVEQGAGLFLGPFGYGITAFEYIHKSGGNASRVTAVEELAQSRTEPIRKALIAALADKDQTVRAAAARGLRSYHDAVVSKAIAGQFTDPKQPVRLNAAAAYLVSAGAVVMPRPVLEEKP